MNAGRSTETEELQRVIARSVATHPVGRNLALIGGFRYRFLDGSVRASDDIDYHWTEDLGEKQGELIDFFRRIVLPDIRRRFGRSGRADARKGPDADSPVVRAVDLRFWEEDVPHSRIEIPVEVTRIICADPVEVRTVGGTIYATASEGDMIESKVVAVFGRRTMRHRDLVDVFLFRDRFPGDSARRLTSKLRAAGITSARTEERLRDLVTHRDYHAKAVQAVIDTQLDPAAAAQLDDAGGGARVLEDVMSILRRYVAAGGSDDIH